MLVAQACGSAMSVVAIYRMRTVGMSRGHSTAKLVLGRMALVHGRFSTGALAVPPLVMQWVHGQGLCLAHLPCTAIAPLLGQLLSRLARQTLHAPGVKVTGQSATLRVAGVCNSAIFGAQVAVRLSVPMRSLSPQDNAMVVLDAIGTWAVGLPAHPHAARACRPEQFPAARLFARETVRTVHEPATTRRLAHGWLESGANVVWTVATDCSNEVCCALLAGMRTVQGKRDHQTSANVTGHRRVLG
mmetsp:Transcript_124047/g.225629  ORF Transcript_124047/g.225629 Transcript_124047/m.225629 type:complete len:244 (+) Transcript_124047:324-1055(+)